MIHEIKEFQRKEIFNHYHKGNNPFIILTTKIDVTNIVNYCKEHKNFYATLGYIITKTANKIDAFKYRYDNGKFYYCDELMPNYTQMLGEDAIGYFGVPFTEDFNVYKNDFNRIQKKFMEDKKYSTENDLNEIWLSCTPWFSFNSLITPFNKDVSIPQFIWDKYEYGSGKYYLNLMIMIHHGFADGYHIGKFLALLNENISAFC